MNDKRTIEVFKESPEFDVMETLTTRYAVNHPVVTHMVDTHTTKRPWWKIPAHVLDALYIATYEVHEHPEGGYDMQHAAKYIREIHGKDVVLVY